MLASLGLPWPPGLKRVAMEKGTEAKRMADDWDFVDITVKEGMPM